MSTDDFRQRTADISREFGLACGKVFGAISRDGMELASYQARHQAAMRLAESMRYRFDAVLYHYGLLWLVYEHYVPAVEELTQKDRRLPPGYLRIAATQHVFLFDDIVFGCASLFDYFAGYTGLALEGVNRQRLKWGNLVRFARATARGESKGIPGLAASAVGAAVMAEEKEWIARLNEYRADVIHHQSDKPDAQIALNILASENWSTLRIFAPKRYLQRMVPSRGKSSDEQRLPIHSTAEALVQRTFDTLKSLLSTLASDIGMRSGRGS
jgi:hypothetical protein